MICVFVSQLCSQGHLSLRLASVFHTEHLPWCYIKFLLMSTLGRVEALREPSASLRHLVPGILLFVHTHTFCLLSGVTQHTAHLIYLPKTSSRNSPRCHLHFLIVRFYTCGTTSRCTHQTSSPLSCWFTLVGFSPSALQPYKDSENKLTQ